MPTRLAPIVFLAVAIFVIAIGVARARSANVALHKPVEISDVLLGDPSGAVNGVVEWGMFAVHTPHGPSWFVVDLQKDYAIDVVRVFGRGDGYHEDSDTPISIELSMDGVRFERAGACDLVMTQVSPCNARIGGARGRYVRLSHPTHLVLSEVEVFEAR